MISEELKKAREYEQAQVHQVPEEERPVFHATAGVGWMNDPNGFSVYKGEYHLFYQYYPYSTTWGPMHWGHAKTRDFLRWEHLPAAMAPDRDFDKDGCWSGSAVELPDGRQLLIYTGRRVREEDGMALQAQCLAVGDGTDYKKLDGNPVLTAADLPEGCSPFDFRDPKMWREADGTYRAIAVTMDADGTGTAVLYESPDGFSWRMSRVVERCRGEYGRMWECPDFFPLDGMQVLLVSPMAMEAQEPEFHAGFGNIAFLGHDDGTNFVRERVQNLDHGMDFYASQTLEALDGRRILIAWMQNWASVKDQPVGAYLCGVMAVPRELSIRDGRLIQVPVRELKDRRTDPVVYKDMRVEGECRLEGVQGRVLDMELTVRPAPENGFQRFRVCAAADDEYRTTIEYVPGESVLRIQRNRRGVSEELVHTRTFTVGTRDGALKLRFVMDRTTLELFVNDGEQSASLLLYTPASADGIRFEAEGGAAVLDVEKYGIAR